MRSDEFISMLSQRTAVEEDLQRIRRGVPLGIDVSGELVLSQKRERALTVRHTCVTGAQRSVFIRRLIITLSCLYEKSEANFLVLSPRMEYGELIRLRSLDITVPFIKNKNDLESAMACVKELLEINKRSCGCPRLFLILDGLEELEGCCNKDEELEEYRAFLELVTRQSNVEVISGAELINTIFSGYPGAFVGVGNCLVTTRENGKADVTYVEDDSSMSLPTAMTFPDAPSFTETIVFLNSLPV